MTIWYFDEFGKVVSRPVAMTSSPSSGLKRRRGQVVFQTTASIEALVVLEREIGVAGGVHAAEAGDFAAHADIAELVLDGALHRQRELGDGEFGGVGAAAGVACGCLLRVRQGRGVRSRVGRQAREGIGMRVLVIGSGGREHALAWKLRQSPQAREAVRGAGQWRDGSRSPRTSRSISPTMRRWSRFAKSTTIDFVVIGPDAPVVAGLGDDVRAAGIDCFGPSKAAAQLEGRRAFTKALCDEMGIPTAAYAPVRLRADALAYVRDQGAPIVIKADGLALRQGRDGGDDHARKPSDAMRDCFGGAFGAAGASVVIEEFLERRGGRASSCCATARTSCCWPRAQDHKRVWDGDTRPEYRRHGRLLPGPGDDAGDDGAGRCTRSSSPRCAACRRAARRIRACSTPGLMLTAEGPKLIEYNARFGDPETQVLMPRLKSDLLDLLQATATRAARGQ